MQLETEKKKFLETDIKSSLGQWEWKKKCYFLLISLELKKEILYEESECLVIPLECAIVQFEGPNRRKQFAENGRTSREILWNSEINGIFTASDDPVLQPVVLCGGVVRASGFFSKSDS